MLAFTFGAIGLALYFFSDSPAGQFRWATLSSLAFAFALFKVIGHLGSPSFCLRYISIFQICQFAILFIFPLLGIEPVALGLSGAGINPDLSSTAGMAIFPGLIPSACAAVLAGFTINRNRPSKSYFEIFQNDPNGTPLVLMASTILLFGILLSSFVPSAIGYFLRIASSSTLGFALFAGFYGVQYKSIRHTWLIALSGAFVIYSMIGGRFLAFFPMLLFAIGTIIGSPPKRRRVLIWTLVLAAFPGFIIIGLIGLLRGEMGRDDFSQISSQRLDEIVIKSSDTLLSIDEAVLADLVYQSLGRIITWPTLVVTSHTPDPIPYRGYDSLPLEIRASAQLYGFGGDIRKFEEAELGTLPAISYGFTVNNETSVEFGVVADGWSRSGLVGATLFTFAYLTMIILFERISVTAKWLTPAARLILLVVCLSNVFRFNGSGLISALRQLIFSFGFWMALTLLISPLLSLYSTKITARFLMLRKSTSIVNDPTPKM